MHQNCLYDRGGRGGVEKIQNMHEGPFINYLTQGGREGVLLLLYARAYGLVLYTGGGGHTKIRIHRNKGSLDTHIKKKLLKKNKSKFGQWKRFFEEQSK